MKSLLTFSISSLLCISSAFAANMSNMNKPEQAKLLAEWVNNPNVTLSEIVKNAAEFDKKMNPNEGITCIASSGELLVHPNPESMKAPMKETPESKKLKQDFFAAVKGKSRTQAVEYAYTFKNMDKMSDIYLVDPNTICLAFWLKPTTQSAESM